MQFQQIYVVMVALCWFGVGAVVGCAAGDEEPLRPALVPDAMDQTQFQTQQVLCFDDEGCLAGLVCYGPGLGEPASDAGYCTQACTTDVECEPMEGMPATCAPNGQCRVDCTGSGQGDGPCPAGTVCRDADPRQEELAYRCMLPPGAGAGSQPEWAQCNPEHNDADCIDGRTCTGSASGDDRLGYCATPCVDDDVSQCVTPAGVTAVPVCAAFLSVCSLDCSAAGSTCPAGMICVDARPGDQVVMRCRYVAADAEQDTTGAGQN